MTTDIGGEAYDYEEFSGLIDDRENDHSYNLWVDSKLEEAHDRSWRIRHKDDGPVVWGPEDEEEDDD